MGCPYLIEIIVDVISEQKGQDNGGELDDEHDEGDGREHHVHPLLLLEDQRHAHHSEP